MDIIFCTNPNDPPDPAAMQIIQQEFRPAPQDLYQTSIVLYGVRGSGKTHQANQWLAAHKNHPVVHQEIYNNAVQAVGSPAHRKTAPTQRNQVSSRSHLVRTCTRCNVTCVDTAGLETGEKESTHINLDLSAVQTWMKKIADREGLQSVRSFSRGRKITQILQALQIRRLVLCFRANVQITLQFGFLGRRVHLLDAPRRPTLSHVIERLDRIEAQLLGASSNITSDSSNPKHST